ncbi:MAG: hypothetical protein AAEJ46_13685 [Planctomycetota bacterium]
MKRYALLCAVSGMGWAVIAYFIAGRLGGAALWGGLVTAPLIGVIAGWVYRPVHHWRWPGRLAMSLLTLYLSALLFGLAWGITDALQGLPGGASRNSIGVVYQTIFATLYGVTATGFVVFLWPLAHLNHWLVGHLAGHHTAAGPPSSRSGSPEQEKP